MTEVTLPYQNATSGKNALNEIQKTLRAFGATSFGVMENFDEAALVLQFEWRGRQISVRASAKGYAAAYLKENPWSPRMRLNKAQHEKRALEQGKVAIYSILRDWIKGQITAVETGMLSFEGAFLGQIMLPSGETVLERVERQPDALGLPAPEDSG